MWIVPSTSCPSSAASECSMSESAARSIGSASLIESRATVSGKPSLRQRSWRGWNARPWSQRLFGTVAYRDWTHAACAVGLISSAEVHPASHTAQRGSKKDLPTQEVSETVTGRCFTSCESSASVDPPWSISRMSRSLFPADTSEALEKNYAEWVMRSKSRSSSLRKRLARVTSGSGFSCWPTAGAGDDSTSSTLRKSRVETGRKTEYLSRTVMAWWPTPNVPNRGPERAEDKRPESGGEDLQTAVMDWQTPGTFGGGNKSRSADRKNELLLAGQARDWATPAAHERAQTPREVDHGIQLANQVENWGTPRVTTNGGIPSPQCTGKGSRLEDQAGVFSHQDQATLSGNLSSSAPQSSSQRLNPAFVCWLMGWPEWWTHPEATNFGASEMESYRSKLLSHLSCLLKAIKVSPNGSDAD